MKTPPCLLLRLVVWASTAFFCALSAVASADVIAPAPHALSTEYRVNPIGLGELHPRLGWQLGFPERGAVQAAYQLQAAATAADLAAARALLWDSGKVASGQSIHVPYAGPALASAQRVYWRVRTWNGAGAPSAWSQPAFFELGLLKTSEWSAQWITADPPEPSEVSTPAPLLRKTFQLDQPVRTARVYVTSLGVYDVKINGQAVTDSVLNPGWTSYDRRLQYQVYDVTAQLRAGENALGVTLGDGWYRGFLGFNPRRNTYGTQLALLLELRLTLADGSVVIVVSDESWKASTGPILASDFYNGETYDARLEKSGWTAPGYDDRGWRPVQRLDRTKDTLIAQAGPPVRRIMELKPVKLLRTPKGEHVFDFGQNLVGWVRLKVRGPAGTTVKLRHAEVLDAAGNFYTENLRLAAQTNTYVLKGDGDETYEPHFTFQGFRYVAIDGFPGEAGAEALTAVVVHSDLGEANTWESSHPLLNRLVKNAEWGQRGNFLDVPTDCPQRDERLGWTGDAQVFARTATYNFNVAAFFTKWLGDVAADQKPNGGVPFVVPDVLMRAAPAMDGAAGWSDVITVIPWTVYQAYGDTRLLASLYPNMKAWVDNVSRLAPDGIWNRSFQFADWLSYQAPSNEARNYPGATTGPDLVATAYFAHSADLVARAARVLGHEADAATYAALAAKVRAAFNREFVTATGRVGENTQTAYALALRFDLLPKAQRPEAARRLVDAIDARNDHLTTGFLGTPALTYALSDHGHLDKAYTLLLQDTYPSWLYPVKLGATTIWERWDGIRPDGTFQDASMNSFNHYSYGAVVAWMYGVVAGIDTDPAAPGYQRSVIRPQPGGGLTSVRARVQTLYGELASAWTVDGDHLRVTVRIPANTRSTVVLPGATLATVKEGDRLLADAGITGARQEGATVVADLGAGEYHFVYPSPALAAKLRLGFTFSLKDSLADLAQNPAARAVLEQRAPAVLGLVQGPNARSSLAGLARFMPQVLTPAVLEAIAADLNRIGKR